MPNRGKQSPVPAGGNMIKREWLRYYEKHELPKRTWRSKIVTSIDLKEAGAIVLVTQRLHMEDLSGFLATAMKLALATSCGCQ